MADTLPIELDSGTFLASLREVRTELGLLKQAFEGLATSPASRLREQSAAMATSVASLTKSVDGLAGQLEQGVQKAMDKAAQAAQAGGRRVGQRMTQGMAEGLDDGGRAVSVVRQQVQKLQAEYEAAVSKGWKVKPDELAGMRVMGIQLTPEDRRRLDEWKTLVASTSDTLARRRKADAADEVALARDTAEKKKAALADVAGYQQMLALRAKAQAEAAEQDSVRALARVAAAARVQYNQAEAVAGTRSSIVRGRTYGDTIRSTAESSAELREESRAAEEAARAKSRLSDDTRRLRDEQRALAERSRDVHAAFRGIAGAAGALWLTYGSLIPLTTAFFATSAIKQAVQDFTELQYQLQFIRALTDDYTKSLDAMQAGVSKVGASFGVMPAEAAQGMRVLAQSGLTASEALASLPSVLAVATVGELGMANAAETLTGAMHAFGLSVDGMGRIGDVFVKAAAISNTSVASIAESMKQASSIADEFKVSVEDVGTMLAALAKRNIVGSAAGTAIRNMFAELAAPRGEAKGIAKQLGISLFDPLKSDVKDFFDTFLPDLRKRLEVFNPQSQTYILHRLFNERGAKAMSALLGMDPADLEQLRQQVTDSTGYALKVFSEANNTIRGDINKLKAEFQGSLAEAGSSVAGPLREALQGITAAVSSQEFQSSLRGLLKLLVDVGGVVGTVGSAMLSPGGMIAAVAALGASALGSNARLAALVPALGTITTAMTGTTVAAGGATVALTGVAAAASALLRFTAIGAIIGGVAFALTKLYDELNRPAPMEKIQAEYADLSKASRDYEEQLQREIQALKERKALQNGDVGSVAEVAKVEEAIALGQKKYQDALTKLRAEEARQDGMRVGQPALIAAARREANEARAQVLALWAQRNDTVERLERIRKSTNELKELQNQPADNGRKFGTESFDAPDKGARQLAASHEAELKRAADLDIAATRATEQRDAAALQYRERMLKASYDQGLVDYSQYQRDLTALQDKGDAERVARIDAQIARTQAEYSQLEAASAASRAAGNNVDPLKIRNDLEQLQQKLQALQDSRTQALNQAEVRRADALTKSLAPSRQLVENSGKEFQQLQLNTRQAMEQYDIKSDSKELSERDLFIQQELNKLLDPYQDKLKEIESVLADQSARGVFDDLSNPATSKALDAILAQITAYRNEIERIREAAPGALGLAYDGKKFQQERRQAAREYERFAKELNENLADAILDAGEDGGKGLRDWLEKELLRKPFKIFLQATTEGLTNAIAAFFNPVGADASAAQGNSGVFGMASNASSLYNLYNNAGSYFNKAASWFGFGGGGGSAVNMAGFYSGASSLAGGSLFGAGSTLAGTGGALGTGTAMGAGAVLGNSGGVLGSGTAMLGEAGTGLAIGGSTTAPVAGGAAAAGGWSAASVIPIIGWIIAGIMASNTMYGKGYSINGVDSGVDLALTGGVTKVNYKVLNAIGLSDKWADILSGGPLMDKTLDLLGISTGERRYGGQYGYSFDGTSVYNPRQDKTLAANGVGATYLEGPSGGEFGQDIVQEAINNTVKGINDLFKAFDSSITVAQFQAGLETSANDKGGVFSGGRLSTGALFGESGTGNFPWEKTSDNSPNAQKALQNLDTDLKQVVIQALQASFDQLPKIIGTSELKNFDAEKATAEEVSALLESIAAKVTAVNEFRDAVKELPFENLRDLSFDAASALLTAAGGLSNLNGLVTNFYQNYYSSTEQVSGAADYLKRSFDQLKIAMPDLTGGADKARASFRALVEAQDVSTDEGQKNYVALLSLASAFTQVTQAIAEQEAALKEFHKAVDVTSFTNLRGLGTSDVEALTGGAGGVSNFNSQFSSFYQSYFSEAEQLASTTEYVRREFANLGLEMPNLAGSAEAARAQFRDLVLAQDVTTDAGRKNFNALMDLAGAFAQITKSAEDSAVRIATAAENMAQKVDLQAQLLRLQGDEAGALKLEREQQLAGMAGYSPEVIALQQQVWAAQDAKAAADAAREASDSALQSLQRAADAQREAAQAALEAAQEQVNTITSLFDLLNTNVRELYGEVESTSRMNAAAGRAFIAQALSAARTTGYMPEEDDLSEAISAVRDDLVADNYATRVDFDRDRLRTAGELSALRDIAGNQKTVAERQLEAAEAQLDRSDQMVKNGQAQLNSLRNINDSVLSVSAAMAALAAAMEKERQAAAAANAAAQLPKDEARLAAVKAAYEGFTTGPDSKSMFDRVKAAGGTLTDLQKLTGRPLDYWERVAKQAGSDIPSFDIGTDYVPHDMLAMVHQGERIQPAAYNRSDATNSALLAVLEQIASAVVELSANNTAENRAAVSNLSTMARLLTRAMPDDSLQVTIVGQEEPLNININGQDVVLQVEEAA